MVRLPGGIDLTDFRDLFVESSDSLTLSWRAGEVRASRGFRSGAALRRLRRGGPGLFRAFDGAAPDRIAHEARAFLEGGREQAVARQAESGNVEAQEDIWGEQTARAIRYIEQIADGLRAIPGARGRLGPAPDSGDRAAEKGPDARLSSDVHLYRQRIHHEDREGGAQDTRRGIRIELTLAGRRAGAIVRTLGAETIEALEAQMPASRVASAVESAATELDEAGAPAFPGGVMPVVFEAGGCMPLLHEIGHLFEEDHARLAHRPFTPGESIGRADLTILDDAGACRGRGSYRFDDEGIGSRSCTLVEAGVTRGRLRCADGEGYGGASDARGPAGSDRTSTGHGRRASYRDLPIPRMSCTYVAPGAAAPEAILRDTPRGLFVRAIRAGNMDPVTGRIVLIVSEGFLIEAGRRTRRIAETLLSGFARDWLGAIDAIGSDLVFDRGAGNCIKFDQQVPVILGMPTVRAADVRVVSPQGRTP